VRCFFDLLIIPLSYNFGGHFKNTYPPINLEYWPLVVMRPSLLTFEPFLTYTLIGLWCRSTSKMLLVPFFELLFLKGWIMSGGLWQALSPLPSFFMVLILLFITNMGDMWRGHHYWIIFKHKVGWPPMKSFICFGPLSSFPKNHRASP